MPTTNLIGYVRVVGQNQAMHHQGAVLGVTSNPAVVNSEIISADQARAMVKRGAAQWIRDDEQAAIAEPASERAARHVRERQDLAERQGDEEMRLLRAHVAGAEAPTARSARHLAEQNNAVLRGASRHDFMALLHRQAEEPKAEALRRFDEHHRMTVRHGDEIAELEERQKDEDAPPAAEHPREPAPPAPDAADITDAPTPAG